MLHISRKSILSTHLPHFLSPLTYSLESIRIRHNVVARLAAPGRMAATSSSPSPSIFPCSPSSITFPDPASSKPTVTDPRTLQALEQAASLIRSNQLVAFPTETVYGLGASALSDEAVNGIFRAKGRPGDNPLIVHVDSIDMLRDILRPSPSSSLEQNGDTPTLDPIPPIYHPLIETFWPGPLTLIFPLSPNNSKISPRATANLSTLAVRMPAHPVARALISISGHPLAAPSANRSGRPSPTKAEHVRYDYSSDSVPTLSSPGKVTTVRPGMILDGGSCDVGVESTVLDALDLEKGPIVLRPGGVTPTEIEETLRRKGMLGEGKRVRVYRKDVRDKEMEKTPRTPGMKYRHYAPDAKVLLLPSLSRSRSIRTQHDDEGTAKAAAHGSGLPGEIQDLIISHVQSLSATSAGPAPLANETTTRFDFEPLRIGFMLVQGGELERLLFRDLSSSTVRKDPSIDSDEMSGPQLDFGTGFDLPPHEVCLEPLVRKEELGKSRENDRGGQSSSLASIAARNLFSALRTLDEPPNRCRLIVVESVEEEGIGFAVMERLVKAAGGNVVSSEGG